MPKKIDNPNHLFTVTAKISMDIHAPEDCDAIDKLCALLDNKGIEVDIDSIEVVEIDYLDEANYKDE